MKSITIKRKYLVFVNGQKAKERLTLAFALKDKKDLESKGLNGVSIGYKLESKEN